MQHTSCDQDLSNRLTRVPEGPVPPLPALVRLLVPAADLFMQAMVSRPSTGSLRTTWVTPASLQLGAVVGVLSLALAALLLDRGLNGGGPLAIACGLLLLGLGVGAGSVAIVGAAQRQGLRPPPQ